MSPVLKANFHSTQRTNCARSAFQILIATEKIIQRLILAIGDPLRQASFYINARNKNHAKEALNLNARLDIKEGCAMSAITMHLMEIYMAKLELLLVKYVLISEFKLYKHLP